MINFLEKMLEILILKVKLYLKKLFIYIINRYNTSLKNKQIDKFANLILEHLDFLYKYSLIIKSFNLYYIN